MNVLLIDHYAGSPRYGMEYRPYYLAREWVEQGHRVMIVAASYSHLRTLQPELAGRTADEEIEGIQYHWYRTPSYRGNGLGRIENMASFLRQIWLDGRRLARVCRPDVVIASSTYPMDIYPARRIARASSAKLVYEAHDLWPLSPVELGIISAWNPLAIVSQHAENYACRYADHIVSLLPKAAAHFAEHGMAPHKFAWVPNGIDVEEWNAADAPLPAEHAEAVARLRKRGLSLIGYAGGHGETNALSYLIEAASHLQDLPVVFVLVGKGTHKPRLQERSQQLGLNNIVFLPPIPKGAIPGFLAAMDALYLGWNRQPVYRFGISPNKLVDYMMSAKPVIHAVEAGNDPVAEAGCGVSCEPENPQAIADSVRKLLSLPPQDRHALGQRGRQFVLNHYSYKTLASRFLQAVAPDSLTVAGLK